MNRRDFLAALGLASALFPGCAHRAEAAPAPKTSVRRVTSGPKHHFFGYYGVCPWNGSETKLLAIETPFQDRLPEPGEPAVIGVVDPETGAFAPVTETRAWNLQQGAMMHWNPLDLENGILFNDLVEGELRAVALDLSTGARRVLPRPISAVAREHGFALSLNYGRLTRLRKVVGYSGATDPHADKPYPEEDGVWRMDLETGETELLVSIAQTQDTLAARGVDLKGSHMWFNHPVINRTDTRFAFLGRSRLESGRLETGMWTAGVDGAALREVVPYGWRVSHLDWRNATDIVVTCELHDKRMTHVLFTDGEHNYQPLAGGELSYDGHCTFSPDGSLLATDRKFPRGFSMLLFLVDPATGSAHELGRFSMGEMKYWSGDTRCDLHPRWNRAGNAICFDAIDPAEGRQLWVARLHNA